MPRPIGGLHEPLLPHPGVGLLGAQAVLNHRRSRGKRAWSDALESDWAICSLSSDFLFFRFISDVLVAPGIPEDA